MINSQTITKQYCDKNARYCWKYDSFAFDHNVLGFYSALTGRQFIIFPLVQFLDLTKRITNSYQFNKAAIWNWQKILQKLINSYSLTTLHITSIKNFFFSANQVYLKQANKQLMLMMGGGDWTFWKALWKTGIAYLYDLQRVVEWIAVDSLFFSLTSMSSEFWSHGTCMRFFSKKLSESTSNLWLVICSICSQWRGCIDLFAISSSRGHVALKSSIVFRRSLYACHSFSARGSLRHLANHQYTA